MKKLSEISDLLVGLEKHATALIACLKAGLPALLVGETGTGKSSLAAAVADYLERPFVRVNLDGGSTPDELIGRYQLRKTASGDTETYFQHGIIPHALASGAILCLDELNAALPDTLFALHPLLESNPRLLIPETGEILTPAPGFGIVATMNPSCDYAGTKALNPALLSRFGALVRFEPLKGKALLDALAVHDPKATADDIAMCASTFEKLNGLRTAELISTRISIRECISALALIRSGLDLSDAIGVSIASKLESHELEQAKRNNVKLSEFVKPSRSKSVAEMIEQIEQFDAMQKENKKLTKKLSAFAGLESVVKTMKSVDLSGDDESIAI